MSVTDQSTDEMFLSLNAFDEIAIDKVFDDDIYVLREKPFSFLRALAFVHFRRSGEHDKAARDAAFNLTIGELNDFFAESDDEEAGKE